MCKPRLESSAQVEMTRTGRWSDLKTLMTARRPGAARRLMRGSDGQRIREGTHPWSPSACACFCDWEFACHLHSDFLRFKSGASLERLRSLLSSLLRHKTASRRARTI